MQTERETSSKPSFEQVVNILRIAGWVSFVMQVGLAAISTLLLLLAIAGRSFNQAIACQEFLALALRPPQQHLQA